MHQARKMSSRGLRAAESRILKLRDENFDPATPERFKPLGNGLNELEIIDAASLANVASVR